MPGGNRKGGVVMKVKTVLVVACVLAAVLAISIQGTYAQGGPDMDFVADVTIPDDTVIAAGEVFTKTWKLKNTGGVDWIDYSLQFVSGSEMGGIPMNIAATSVDETADVIVVFTAPEQDGAYTGWWRLVDESGNFVGSEFYVRITVVGGTGRVAQPTTEANDAVVTTYSQVIQLGSGNAQPTTEANDAVVTAVASDVTMTEIHTDFTGEPFAGKGPLINDPERPYDQIFQEGGLLHFKQLKTKMENGEYKQGWWFVRTEERAFFKDMTLDVEIGRLDGDGWGGGGAVVMFGITPEGDHYRFQLKRHDQEFSLGKVIDGQWYDVFPAEDSPHEWEVGATINGPDLVTGQAWDWVKLICETVEGGTRIAVYSKGVLIGERVDTTYKGGHIGLGTRTWGYASHTVYSHLHVVPYVHYD
jgi:hypothetical protein